MISCETLVYGATFFGIGYAIGKGNCMIVDPTINPGHEFANAFRQGDFSGKELQTETARELKEELEKCRCFQKNRLHIASLVPALCRVIQENQLFIRLDSIISGIERKDEKYSIRLSGPDGITTVEAPHIIDTITVPDARISRKTLNALLHGMPGAEFADIPEFIPGCLPDKAEYCYQVDPEDGFPEARRKIEAFWKTRSESLKAWRIAATASEFDEIAAVPRKITGDGVKMIFAKQFANPLEALDAGIMEGTK